MSEDIGSLLGRWHQWRGRFSYGRGYVRARGLDYDTWRDGDDELEEMLMSEVEQAVNALPPLQQLALQHVARYECLGVEVMKVARLPTDRAAREALCASAVKELRRKLASSVF